MWLHLAILHLSNTIFSMVGSSWFSISQTRVSGGTGQHSPVQIPSSPGRRVKPLPAIQGAIENVVIGVRRPSSAVVMPGKLGLRGKAGSTH